MKKNYSVKIEFEYWSHGTNEDNAVENAIRMLADDIKTGGLDNYWKMRVNGVDVTVKEIDEDGSEI